jgi:membrane protease YdiL (CAAX protease family)
VAASAVLTAYNNVFGLHPWHSRWYVRLNAGATGAALAAAALSGLTPEDIGIGRGRWLPGWLGCGLAAGAGAGWLVIAAVPATRPLLDDKRAAGLGGRETAYQALIRIPVGTALWEEAAFRGVLQAALRRVMSDTAAIVVTSGVFGAWHVRPTLQALRVNGLAGDRRRALAGTCAGVAGTAAAGALLSWLRARSGRLAAPVLLHAAANSGALLAAHAVAARSQPGGVPRRRRLHLGEQLGLLGFELFLGKRAAVAQLRELGDAVERIRAGRCRGPHAHALRAVRLRSCGRRRATGRRAPERGAGQPGRPANGFRPQPLARGAGNREHRQRDEEDASDQAERLRPRRGVEAERDQPGPGAYADGRPEHPVDLREQPADRGESRAKEEHRDLPAEGRRASAIPHTPPGQVWTNHIPAQTAPARLDLHRRKPAALARSGHESGDESPPAAAKALRIRARSAPEASSRCSRMRALSGSR